MKYADARKLKKINQKIILTREGKLFADRISSDLFFEEV